MGECCRIYFCFSGGKRGGYFASSQVRRMGTSGDPLTEIGSIWQRCVFHLNDRLEVCLCSDLVNLLCLFENRCGKSKNRRRWLSIREATPLLFSKDDGPSMDQVGRWKATRLPPEVAEHITQWRQIGWGRSEKITYMKELAVLTGLSEEPIQMPRWESESLNIPEPMSIHSGGGPEAAPMQSQTSAPFLLSSPRLHTLREKERPIRRRWGGGKVKRLTAANQSQLGEEPGIKLHLRVKF